MRGRGACRGGGVLGLDLGLFLGLGLDLGPGWASRC